MIPPLYAVVPSRTHSIHRSKLLNPDIEHNTTIPAILHWRLHSVRPRISICQCLCILANIDKGKHGVEWPDIKPQYPEQQAIKPWHWTQCNDLCIENFILSVLEPVNATHLNKIQLTNAQIRTCIDTFPCIIGSNIVSFLKLIEAK